MPDDQTTKGKNTAKRQWKGDGWPWEVVPLMSANGD